MKRILNIFTRPFNENLAIFVVILLLTTSIDFINAIHNEAYKYSSYILLQGFLTSYILTIVQSFSLNKIYKRITSTIILTIISIIAILDIFCKYQYGTSLNEFFVGMIYQTNISEAREFIATYVTKEIIILFIVY